jgi:hypothetical protein
MSRIYSLSLSAGHWHPLRFDWLPDKKHQLQNLGWPRTIGKGDVIGFDIGEACKDRDARRDSERWNRLGRGAANRDPEQEAKAIRRRDCFLQEGLRP